MTKCFYITVEYAVVWMQTWMPCCQHSGMLRKLILCHVCKHVVKFLEASNAQYVCRSAAKLPAINLMSLGQIRYTVCTPKAEFIWAQQILHARWNFLPTRWPSVEGSFFHSSLENSQLKYSSPVTSEQPKTGVGRKYEIYQPEDCLI